MIYEKVNLRVRFVAEKGYVVEIQKRKWYGKKYWVHFISYSGLPKKPFHYSTKENAINESLRYIRYEILGANPYV